MRLHEKQPSLFNFIPDCVYLCVYNYGLLITSPKQKRGLSEIKSFFLRANKTFAVQITDGIKNKTWAKRKYEVLIYIFIVEVSHSKRHTYGIKAQKGRWMFANGVVRTSLRVPRDTFSSTAEVLVGPQQQDAAKLKTHLKFLARRTWVLEILINNRENFPAQVLSFNA